MMVAVAFSLFRIKCWLFLCNLNPTTRDTKPNKIKISPGITAKDLVDQSFRGKNRNLR
jgi:hypothetical protein